MSKLDQSLEISAIDEFSHIQRRLQFKAENIIMLFVNVSLCCQEFEPIGENNKVFQEKIPCTLYRASPK